MPKTATITVEIEPELKERAASVLKKMGLTVADAVALFLRQVERQQELPFDTDIPNRMTRRVMGDTDRGKNLIRFDNADELFKYLRE
ncbi:MAG TPA: type II toxin-antitoxin system RelB/DinJ family antitoxin [Candidatus Kapabacteria bacterium]|jgi:DNA-damage-inducible protein J|nr:type II toxin-antitoxin system RelB/DinJ family antitoxin [Candidatus Kapabacteria bacterium]